MKNNFKIVLFILTIFFVVNVNAQKNTIESVISSKDYYQYPVKPGDKKWNSFNTYKERVQVLQIPENILNKMSTEGLIQTCLNYPYWCNIISADNYQNGFKVIVSEFNGMKELLNRKNAGEKLLKIYAKINPEAIMNDSSVANRGEFLFALFNLEMILAQDEIISRLDSNEKYTIIKEGLSKFHSKSKYPEIYGNLSQTSALFVVAKTLYAIQGSSFSEKKSSNDKINLFMNQADLKDVAVVDEIIRNAEEYILNKK